MLGLVETLVGRELGRLRGLREGLGRAELLRTTKTKYSVRCSSIYK